MISDSKIFTNVNRRLATNPRIEDQNIVIGVKNGIVTITGHVGNCTKKRYIEDVVKSVKGVLGIGEELVVDIYGHDFYSNSELSEAVAKALHWDSSLKKSYNLQAVADQSIITLTGNVEHLYQKERIYDCVSSLHGVKTIINRITVNQSVAPKYVKNKIIEDFLHIARMEAGNINVDVKGNEVVLKGRVKSWREYVEAHEVAHSIPGISSVKNLIAISS